MNKNKSDLISVNCPPPAPRPGKAVKLTDEQKNALIEFAEEHAPAFVPRIRRAQFVRNEGEWYILLDAQENPVGCNVHAQLWEELFGG